MKRIKIPPSNVPSKAALSSILNQVDPDEKMGVKEPFQEASKQREGTKYIPLVSHPDRSRK